MKSMNIARGTLLVILLIALLLMGCGTTATEAVPGELPTGQPSSPASEHFRRGNELSQAGQFEEAVNEYQQALEDEPDSVDALSNLGVAYYNLGQLDKAIEQYSRAIELAPDDADIHSNLAAAYVQEYQLTGSSDTLNKALDEYQKATKLDPNLPEAHFGLGVIYALQGRTDDAIQAFESFQKLDTGADPMATANAAEYLRQLRGQ